MNPFQYLKRIEDAYIPAVADKTFVLGVASGVVLGGSLVAVAALLLALCS